MGDRFVISVYPSNARKSRSWAFSAISHAQVRKEMFCHEDEANEV